MQAYDHTMFDVRPLIGHTRALRKERRALRCRPGRVYCERGACVGAI